MDLPAPATDNELGSYLLAQLTHRRRVPYNLDMDGFGGAVTPEMYDLVLRLGMDAHVPNHPPDLELDMHRFRCKGGCGGVEHLRQRGYRFLVLHRTGHSALDGRFRRCLERCVPAPIFADDDVRAYELPAAGGAGVGREGQHLAARSTSARGPATWGRRVRTARAGRLTRGLPSRGRRPASGAIGGPWAPPLGVALGARGALPSRVLRR